MEFLPCIPVLRGSGAGLTAIRSGVNELLFYNYRQLTLFLCITGLIPIEHL